MKLDSLLTLLLDSPMGSYEISCWLLTGTYQAPHSAPYLVEATLKKLWPLPASIEESLPIYCQGCASRVGSAELPILVKKCNHCKGETKVSSLSQAIDRLKILGGETVTSNLRPIISYLEGRAATKI